MRLYQHPLSFNSRRAVMAALELGAPVELVLVDLARGAQRRPEFLRLNPHGRVPVLDDDGFHLSESHAIMQYLADKTPGQTLYPAEIRARADVNRWLFWSAHHFTPAVAVLGWEHVVRPILGLGAPDPAAVKRGETLVQECAQALDRHLAERTWIAGDSLSLADLALATPLMMAGPAKLPVADAPHLLRWFERMQARDAWQNTDPARPPS